MTRVRIAVISRWLTATALLFLSVVGPTTYAMIGAAVFALDIWAWRHSVAPRVRVVLAVCTAVVLPVLAQAAGAGAVAVLATLPALSEIETALRHAARAVAREDYQGRSAYDFGRDRTAMPMLRSLVVVIGLVLILGLVTGHQIVAASAGVLAALLLALLGLAVLRLPARFVDADVIRLRLLVARSSEFEAPLRMAARWPSVLTFRSPFSWLQITPTGMPFGDGAPGGRGGTECSGAMSAPRQRRPSQRALGSSGVGSTPAALQVRVTPPLSGPTRLTLDALAIDPWGLTGARQQLVIADLEVIPRAKYAGWLARRYLERTSAAWVASASVATQPRAAHGGLDYYGARSYAAGDTFHDIDWKHTSKLRRLIVKEFQRPAQRGTIILADLKVPDAESADRLAYLIITAALTLAEDGASVVLAGYTERTSAGVSSVLSSRAAVKQSLLLAGQIVRAASVRRTMEIPNVGRLRRLRRLVDGLKPEGGLARLLALELETVNRAVGSHPGAQALRTAAGRLRPPATILTLSAAPHQDVGVAAMLERLQAAGYRTVRLDGRSTGVGVA